MRMGSAGMAVMLVVFLVAVVFAANQNEVVGWLVAIISLGWLLIFSFVVFSLRSAARRAADKINEVQLQGKGSAGGQGSRVPDQATLVRDKKLDHSFKIVQVQAGVVREYLGKDEGMVERALETIEITSSNARSMMKGNDDDPVEGTVIS